MALALVLALVLKVLWEMEWPLLVKWVDSGSLLTEIQALKAFAKALVCEKVTHKRDGWKVTESKRRCR